MLKSNPFESNSAVDDGADKAPSFDLAAYVGILRRQWPLIAGLVATCLMLAAAYLLTAQARYTAAATILIDTRKNQLLGQQQQVVGDQVLDTSGVDSQVEILKSESISLSVIRELKLADDPAFMGSGSVIGALIGAVLGDDDAVSDTEKERLAMDIFERSLQVRRVGVTYAIDVNFTTTSPARSAAIANAIADAYTVSELESRYQATRRASRWLQDRIQELRQQATTADSDVQRFRSANNIIDTGRGLLGEQQLSDVNGQLASARAATAEAKARLDRITSMNNEDVTDATVADALKNDVITRLRAQYLDLSAREADWSARFGAEHGAARNIRNQMREIRRSITDEVKRIAETYKSEYEIARAREQSLQQSLASLIQDAGAAGQAQVQLRDLESSAQTYRNLYDNFLQRFMEATQQQTFPVSEARVITAATPPRKKSWPKTPLVLGGATLLGLLLGAGSAVGREKLGRTSFRTTKEIETETGLECIGILPRVTDLPAAGLNGAKPSIARYAVDAPFSRFAETIRTIKVAADLNGLNRRNRIIGIVSALPNEGKTTVAANVAAAVSAADRKVLLIDGDLRNPSLTKLVAPKAEKGLVELLRREVSLGDAIHIDPSTGFHFIPAVVKGRIWQTAEMISSGEMATLLTAAREQYDYVLVDLPPIVPIVDVRAVSHLVDSFVMVIEWGATSREVVAEALASVESLRERMIGLVLNKANPAQLKRIEGYKGRYYNSYYRDRSAA